MPEFDARKLSPEAQQALRERAVEAHVVGGMKQKDVAAALGVSPYIVSQWVKYFRARGKQGLAARKKGPPKGTGALLTKAQAKTIRNLVIDKCPEQLKLPFFLWTRDAVSELIRRKFGIRIAVRTAGNYLRDWGFTPQKPVRRAYEKDDAAVQRWLQEEYPALQKRAKAEKAHIYWCDETGLRSDHQAGRSYGLRGRTPVIPGTGQRFGCNMISAIANQGQLSFLVFEGSFNYEMFIEFLRRLYRQVGGKVFVIVDGHPVHHATAVQEWCRQHHDQVELVFLPGYSPELNPDELLNQDVKSNALGKRRPHNLEQLIADLHSYLWSTQKQPDIIRNFFEAPHVRYAKA